MEQKQFDDIPWHNMVCELTTLGNQLGLEGRFLGQFGVEQIRDALTEITVPDCQPSIFETIAAEIGELVTEKNRAYGNSFAKCGDFLRLLYPSGIAPAQYDDALAMVRIFDKQMRIATQKEALSESPYRDIAGYGILGAAKDQGKGE